MTSRGRSSSGSRAGSGSAPALPSELEEAERVLRQEIASARPLPPPLKIAVSDDPHTKTFSVDLTKMLITVPRDYSKYRNLPAYILHEIKHASFDGAPTDYRAHLTYLARMIKGGIDRKTAQDVLNVVYDAAVDIRVNKKYKMKDAQEEWLKHFPIAEEGTPYHLLNIMYRDLFGVSFKETGYECEVRSDPNKANIYKSLKNCIADRDFLNAGLFAYHLLKKRASQGGGGGGRREKVGKGQRQGQGEGKGQRQGEGKGEEQGEGKGQRQGEGKGEEQGRRSGGTPQTRDVVTASTEGIELEVLEIAAQEGLTAHQTAQLMGCSLEEMVKRLEGAARKALWQAVAAYRGRGEVYSIQERSRRRWREWDRDLDPSSVTAHPFEPEMWAAPALIDTVQTETEGGEGGCASVVIAIDKSGSMRDEYMGRTKLAWAKDAAVGLIAFAREHRLPARLLAYSNNTYEVGRTHGAGEYERLVIQAMYLFPYGGTSPDTLVDHLSGCDDGTLIAIITDGEFDPEKLRAVTKSAPSSKVICAIVNTSLSQTAVPRVVEPNLEIYQVTPSSAGAVLVERAKQLYK